MRKPVLILTCAAGLVAISFAALTTSSCRAGSRSTSGPATRQSTRSEPKPETAPASQEGFRYRPRREVIEIAEAVGLTDQQWKAIGAEIEELAAKQAKWLSGKEKQLQSLALQVAEARKTGNRSRIRRLETQLKPLLQERNSIFVNELDVVASTFTEKQKVAHEAWRLLRTVMRTYEQAGMTDKQKATAKLLCSEYAARRIAAPTWREKTAIRKELLKAVHQKVLTEDQRIAQEAFELNRSAMWFYRLTFTDAQRAEISELCNMVAAERIKTDNWREQARLRRQMLRTIYLDVMTDQQRSEARNPGPVPPSTQPAEHSPFTRPTTPARTTTAPS